MKERRICYIKHYPLAMRAYLFDCTDIDPPLEVGEYVICDTVRGHARGQVVTLIVGQAEQVVARSEAPLPLKKVIGRQEATLFDDDLPF